jgi:hypothetical protein
MFTGSAAQCSAKALVLPFTAEENNGPGTALDEGVVSQGYEEIALENDQVSHLDSAIPQTITDI